MNSTELHILIAEDELSHAVIMRRRLEKEYPDARIDVVTSIRDYRSSIAAATPTIVLLDLNLADGCTPTSGIHRLLTSHFADLQARQRRLARGSLAGVGRPRE